MRKATAIVLFALPLVACSPKIVPTVTTKDSVRVEIHERIVRDTVSVEIPVEVEKVVTRDTVSFLKNTYAKSEAVVSGGFLYHSLESIPKFIRVPVEVSVTDTVFIEKSAVKSKTTVEVEKPLSWWQKARLRAFWWLCGATILLLAWTFRKFIKF